MITRRDFCKGLLTLPAGFGTAASWRSQLPPEWAPLFDIITTVRQARDGELPSGAYAGLKIAPNAYEVLLTQTSNRVYTLSVLIHEAWHAHQHRQGRKYYGKEAEREAWSIQALALSSIDPQHPLVPWLWEQSAKQPESYPLPGNP